MNKNILSNVIMFAVGAAIGSIATWKLINAKYEKRFNDEINEFYENQKSEDEVTEPVEDVTEAPKPVDPVNEARQVYSRIINDAAYGSDDEEEDDDVNDGPYVITPNQFDEMGYETVSLYYYEDGVVETMLDKEVLDEETIEDYIGKDSLTHFGEYEDDSVFVRNDNLETDFEILRVSERYHSED